MQRVLLLLVGLAAVLGVAVWFDRSLDPINPATFERIKLGMTLKEEEPLIGKKPNGRPCALINGTRMENWHGNSYHLQVEFDTEGKVVGRSFGKWRGFGG